jgi:hypothetical protein
MIVSKKVIIYMKKNEIMLITKEIEINITNRNKTKIQKLVNIKINIGDIIKLPVDKLSIGSNVRVTASCDYCSKVINMSYKDYNNYTKVVNKISCSEKTCSNQKIKEVCNIKYGVDNPFQYEDFKQKSKNTLINKYGVEHQMHLEEVKEKIKNTCLYRYGETSFNKTELFLEKIKKTNLEKYGVEWSLQSKDVKNKVIKTNLEKWNVEYASQSKIFRDKVIQTSLNKWGVECNLQSSEVKEQIKKTCIEKYNVENPMQSDSVRIIYNITQNPNYIKYLYNSISLFNCDCDKQHEFEIKSDNYISRKKNNLPLCTICYPIAGNNSIKELEVLKFIQSIYKGEILPGYRDNLEIDIYLPELKLGFEFNGLYWHSNEFKENNYHLDKTLYFKEKGIRIIHIFEDNWNLKQTIICSQIKNLLGLTDNRIFARKCQVKEITDVKDFLENNHIQGNVSSVIKLGLYYNTELVSVMTFDKFEGRKKMEEGGWNLSRFCNKLNYNVVGSASKLLNYFLKTYNTSRIISYADRIWSEGNLYYKLGFQLIDTTRPDYKYIINGVRKHKSNFKKSKLNTKLTESQEMTNKGINKIYDCGKLKFEIKKTA